MNPFIRQATAGLFGLAALAGAAACGDDAEAEQAFCEQLAEADDRLDQLFARSELGGEDSREATDQLVALGEELTDAAPEQIKADLGTVAAGFEAFRDELSAARYDVQALGQPQSLGDEDTLASFEAVAEFGRTECDVNLDD